MSMLRIDGYTVPAASLDEGEDEIGSRDRAVNGAELIDRIGVVRKWSGVTKPSSADVIDAIRRILRGEGDVWPFDGDTWSAKGVDENSGTYEFENTAAADGASVSTAAKFGTGSLAVNLWTTNILAQNVRTGTDTLGTTSGFATVGISIASVTSDYWQGARSLRAIGSAGSWCNSTGVSCSASTNYSGSVYCKGEAGGEPISVSLYDNGGGLISTTTATLTTSWQRITVTGVTDSGASTISIRLEPTSGGPHVWYSDGFQVEARDTATSWVDGTRASDEYLRLDATSYRDKMGSDWTFNLWMSVGDTTVGSSGDQLLVGLHDGTQTNGVRIYEAAGEIVAEVYGGDASPDTVVTTSGAAVNDRAFHMITVVYDRSAGLLTVYVDGASAGTDTGVEKPDFSAVQYFWVGGEDLAVDVCNGQIDDLLLVPYAASASQVAAWYSSGIAHSALPRIYVDGDFINDDDWTILATGVVGKSDYLVADGNNNYRTQQFQLVEADLAP